MKKLLIIVGVLAVAVAGYFGYRVYTERQAAAQPADPPVAETDSQENVIWASGKLVPARWAGLSPAVGGTIKAVYVGEGDRVEAGQVLGELDNAVLASQVAVAQAAVAEAEAARAKLLEGAPAEELAGVAADVSGAQAALSQAQAASLQAQQAAAAAQAQVAIAEAQYNELASRPTRAERIAAQRQVDQAQAAVKTAQAAYDTVAGDPHIGARPEAMALEQATLGLQSAQAAYDVGVQGATAEQLAVARAQVNAARAQAGVTAGQAPVAQAAVQAAKAQVSRAEAALARLKAGATAADIALAGARVQSAQAAVATAQAQLAQTQVSAPFAGQVGAVYFHAGELAVPGQPLLVMGDTAAMQIETTDLRETDVARLAAGLPVEVTFDALPGQTFRGEITRIAPMSTSEQGSTNYTVIVEVADLAPGLRWGMTAFVNIQVK